MPGHLQEGFGCVVTNRFDQLFDDEEDPFEVLKQAEKKKKDATAPGAAKTAAQAAKQPKKESQKERRNPLPDKKEETQAPVPLKKDGKFLRLQTRHLITLFLSVQCAKRAAKPMRSRTSLLFMNCLTPRKRPALLAKMRFSFMD